jgi:hypothetical protein
MQSSAPRAQQIGVQNYATTGPISEGSRDRSLGSLKKDAKMKGYDCTSHPGTYPQATLRDAGRPFNIRHTWILLFGCDPMTSRKSGPDQHRVMCPFHSERNPSCDVSLSKNVFICRSCNARGGTLDAVICGGRATTHSEAAQWLRDRGAL